MKISTAVMTIIADIAIAFMVWVVSDNLTSGWLVLTVVLGMVAIAAITSAAAAENDKSHEDNKVRASVDDIRK